VTGSESNLSQDGYIWKELIPEVLEEALSNKQKVVLMLL